MTASLLTWRPAVQRDRAALTQFVCTNPAKAPYVAGMKKQHPREWELEVQSGLRAQRPPYGDGSVLLLGQEAGGRLGAVTLTGYDNQFAATIRAIAVAQHLRHQATRYGPEALDVTLTMIRGHRGASGRAFRLAQAYIHPRNTGSQRLFRDHGFLQVESGRPGFELWALVL